MKALEKKRLLMKFIEEVWEFFKQPLWLALNALLAGAVLIIINPSAYGNKQDLVPSSSVHEQLLQNINTIPDIDEK